MKSGSGDKESAAPESPGFIRKVLQWLVKYGPLRAFLMPVVTLVRVYIHRGKFAPCRQTAPLMSG